MEKLARSDRDTEARGHRDMERLHLSSLCTVKSVCGKSITISFIY